MKIANLHIYIADYGELWELWALWVTIEGATSMGCYGTIGAI
jgi:hypothetical protein